MAHLWARLQSYNKKAGFTQKRYHFANQLFIVGAWYKVNEKKAEALEALHQEDQNPHSPALFQICTEEEKNGIDKVEYNRRMVQLGLMAAGSQEPAGTAPQEVDLTTADLPGAGRDAAVPPTAKEEPAAVAPKKTSENRSVLSRLTGEDKSKPLAKKTAKKSGKKQ